MTKNLIFDFGDIFFDLDKTVLQRAMLEKGIDPKTSGLIALNEAYEVGAISSEAFLAGVQKDLPTMDKDQIKTLWNGVLVRFPDYRLEFLEELAREGNYRFFLLSNNNALHTAHAERLMGRSKYLRFKNCFEQFYLSQEIGLRKPDAECFRFVLESNGLKAGETLFIDDTKENTDMATSLGLGVWNLSVGHEDIVELRSRL